MNTYSFSLKIVITDQMQQQQYSFKENQPLSGEKINRTDYGVTTLPLSSSLSFRVAEERMTFLPFTPLHISIANISCNGPISKLNTVGRVSLTPTNTSNINNVDISSSTCKRLGRKEMQNMAWFKRFEELKDYKVKNGDCNVPQKYHENPSLGIWVNKQRSEYKMFQEGEKSSMTNERQQLLESIGFQWAKQKGQTVWDAKFQLLKEYKSKHGDCAVPTKYMKDQALGRWVSTQREQYQFWTNGDSRCKLTYENFMKLNELGFIWRLQTERKDREKNVTNANGRMI